jgi:hypothetical protein
MSFFEGIKHTESFNESIDAKSFLQEMVTTQYSEQNLEFAKVLEEAFDKDYLVSLSEDDKSELSRQVAIMESRLNQLKEICSLQEGFGFISWVKRYGTGSDSKFGERVQHKINAIRTQEDKDKLLADLKKAKQVAQSISGTKDKARGEFLSDLVTAYKSQFANSLIPFGGMIRLIRVYDGTVDDFIKGIDVLIRDVQSVKIKK